MPKSVIIAGIVGFVLGAITNLVVGLICGGMFALIMWALTGFRTEESKPETARTTQETTATSESSRPPDTSSLSEERKSQKAGKVGIGGWLSIAFIGLFLSLSLLAFLKLLFEEGWSSASQKHPSGGLLFFAALAIAYFFAILLVEKRNKDMARKMIWAAVAAGGLVVVSMFPSCQGNDRAPTDIYYRR